MDAFVTSSGKPSNTPNDLGLDLLINKRKQGQCSSDASRSEDLNSVRSYNVIDVGEHVKKSNKVYKDKSIDEFEDEYEEDLEEDNIDMDELPKPRNFGFQKRPIGVDGSSVVSYGQYSNKSFGNTGHFRPIHPLNVQETDAAVIAQKKELLYQFDRMEKKGMILPRKFTISSSLDEMKQEYDRLKRDKEIDSSIKMQRRILMATASGIEWLNNKFDPVGAKLDGWSDSLYENINDYDDVFEELHDKYKTSTQLPPEIKLIMMMSGSAFMHHMTHTMFKTQLPGLDEILKQNPELAKNLATATSEHMAHQQSSAGNLFGSLGGMFSGMFGGGAPQTPSPSPVSRPFGGPTTENSNNMRGPANVDDIMKEFETMNRQPINEEVPIQVEVSVPKPPSIQDELEILERLADEEAAIISGVTSPSLNGPKKSLTLDI